MMDSYAATASAYDLLNLRFRTAQLAALSHCLPHFRSDVGPILDIGAGSGLNTALVLERLDDARILAIEPSAAMRSLLMAKLADHPEWHHRVTVRPEVFGDAPLPDRIGGAILLGVIGHFDAEQRQNVFRSLARRLARAAPALIDLQAPERAEDVAPFQFAEVCVGDLTYRGVGHAVHVGDDKLQWHMKYQTLDGDQILHQTSTDHIYHHPPADKVQREAQAAGLTINHIGDSTFWMLTVAA